MNKDLLNQHKIIYGKTSEGMSEYKSLQEKKDIINIGKIILENHNSYINLKLNNNEKEVK